MPRIFITGSTDGLGAPPPVSSSVKAMRLSCTPAPASGSGAQRPRPGRRGVVIGDLSSAAETRALADQVNQIGRMDAVIHNAGIFEPSRATTADGHAKTLAVNTLAPYMLTALIDRPDRLIHLSSGLHHAGPCGISTGPGGNGTPYGPTPRASSR